jgi:hypothetical protein
MTSSSYKLNEADINYLLHILNDEEQRQYANIEIRDNVEVAKANLERITRIRLAVLGPKEG